jgi:glycine/D-amino acid oxidase-like deaminating enzyme
MVHALPATADAVVIGAGVVGASCAYYLAEAGLTVVVVDRVGTAGGTTSAGEGNILVSDKEIGAELSLALLSRNLWEQLHVAVGNFEFESKGGIVVAASDSVAKKLAATAVHQSANGVEIEELSTSRLLDYEPNINPDLVAAIRYAQDAQVQPMKAAAALLQHPRITVFSGIEVTAITTSAAGSISGLTTNRGSIATEIVVNAAGTWGGEIAALAGVNLPIHPRRGFLLVTEPLPQKVFHKVYTAEYLDNVASDSAGLETSTVVEGTQGGTILIGASRERVGFDKTVNFSVLSRLAAGAIAVFPFLKDVMLLRTYGGFRPYCPDHLPVIGPDSRVPGLFHACGHEGAGVGLAPASGLLIAQSVMGETLSHSLEHFRPERFDAEVSHVSG